jgi:hypothetical protein
MPEVWNKNEETLPQDHGFPKKSRIAARRPTCSRSDRFLYRLTMQGADLSFRNTAEQPPLCRDQRCASVLI